MTPDEIPRLISTIGLADSRLVPGAPEERRGMAAMWTGILAAVPYDFALHAAQQHYAESAFTIRPADIAARWRAHVRDRRDRDVDVVPDADPDDVDAWLDALRQDRRQHIVDNRPRPVAALVRNLAATKQVPDTAAEARAVLAPRRHPARAVKCPRCNARIGTGCSTSTGRPPAGGVHPSRVDRWAAGAVACPTCRAPVCEPCTEADKPYVHDAHRERIAAAEAWS